LNTFYQYSALPSQWKNSDIIPAVDFHIHTRYADGKASVDDVARIAVEKNLEAIAFTEHTESWHHMDDADWFSKYVNDIALAREKYANLRIFCSVEAPVIDFEGNLFLEGVDVDVLDFVLGAAHRYPGTEGRKTGDLTPQEAIELEYKCIYSLITRSKADIIAHIGATCTKYVTPFPQDLIRELLKLAAKHDKIVEINPVYHQPLGPFLEMCIAENVRVIPGSNAHGFGDIGLVVEKLKLRNQ
jgi:histidinol phosphatase-like PHP family hydrolase